MVIGSQLIGWSGVAEMNTVIPLILLLYFNYN